jgi:glycosyltransferase involved in cell wall biosynthesis
MAKEIGVENNFFLSYKVPYEKIPQFLVNKNVGIIIRKYAANYGYRRGSLGVIKFFQYMSAGLPIICTDFDEWKTIIDENQCGIYVNPYDVNEIKNAILFLKDNPAVAKTMGDNAKKAFKTKYNWETQVGIYLDCFEK